MLCRFFLRGVNRLYKLLAFVDDDVPDELPDFVCCSFAVDFVFCSVLPVVESSLSNSRAVLL